MCSTRTLCYASGMQHMSGAVRSDAILAILTILLFLCTGLSFGREEEDHDGGFSRLWRYSTGGRIRALLYDEHRDVYFAASEDRYLHAFDSRGRRIWRSFLEEGSLVGLELGCDGTVYALTEGSLVVAFNAAGGTAWKIRPFEEGIEELFPLGDGGLLVVSPEGRVKAYSHTAQLRWSAKIFGPGTAGGVSAATVSTQSVLYVGFRGGDMVALSENGVELWHRRREAPVAHLSALGRAVVLFEGGQLSCYSEKGETLWRKEVEGVVSAAVGDGLLALRTTDGFLSLYDAEGRRLWRTPAGGGRCSLAVGGAEVVLLDDEGWCEYYAIGGVGGQEQYKDREQTEAGGESAREWRLVASGRLAAPESEPVIDRRGAVAYGSADWLLQAYGPETRVQGADRRTEGSTDREADRATDRGTSGRTALSPRGLASVSRCRSNRSGGIEAFPVLKEELAAGTRERKRKILDTVERRLSSASPMPHKKAYLSVLEELAGEAVLEPEYRRNTIVNDYPEIRSEAVRLLGIYGDTASAGMLRSVLANEWDAAVTLACVVALGRLGGLADGSALGLMRGMVSSESYNGNDPAAFALAVLTAVERISVYRGRLSGNVMEILRSIYLGTYPRSVRKEAISTLRGLKGSAYRHFNDYTESETRGEE